jgi:hypothetical protein
MREGGKSKGNKNSSKVKGWGLRNPKVEGAKVKKKRQRTKAK